MARRTLPPETLDDIFAERKPRVVAEPLDAEAPPVEVECPPWADVLDDESYRAFALYGGRGAGRSWSVARKLLKRAHARPLRVLCTREYQASIKDSVHQLLKDQIEALGLPFEVLKTEIRHPNGSLFIFEGMRVDPDALKSKEGIDVAWVEEASTISQDSLKKLAPTIRKDGSQLIFTFNTDLETDPVYVRYVKHAPPRTYSRLLTWKDNPFFPDTLREEMEYDYAVDAEAAEHIWGGQFRRASAAQILRGKYSVQSFEPVTWDELVPDPALRARLTEAERAALAPLVWSGPYYGLDFGFAFNPFVLSELWIYNRRLYIRREAYKVGLELDATADFCIERVPGCERYAIMADAAEPKSISYLKRHGLPRIKAAEKWSGSVEEGIRHLRQYEEIIIHPDCTHGAEEARLYSYKVDERTGDVKPEIVDKHNHCIDSWRYALSKLIATKQTPRLFHAGMVKTA